MIDNQRLQQLQQSVELVLNDDMEKLSSDNVKRLELWNNIVNSENTFEKDFMHNISTDLTTDIVSKFSFAKLRLAVADLADDEQTGIASGFNQEEISLVSEFDKYNTFDMSSPEEISEKMKRRGDIYHLIQDYRKEYEKLDDTLDSPRIRRNLKVFLKNRFRERLNNIDKALKIHVGKYGIVTPVEQIERSILDEIKKSEDERARILKEQEIRIRKLRSQFDSLPQTDVQAEYFKEILNKLQAQVWSDDKVLDLKAVRNERENLAEKYSDIENELSAFIKVLLERQNEITQRQTELKEKENELKGKMEEEKQRVIENEIKELEFLKSKLTADEKEILDEKSMIQIKKRELDERLRQITEAAEGKPLRIIKKEDARLCELNFIARFDTKMNNFPLKIHSPINNKQYDISSWKDDDHQVLSERNLTDTPNNTQSKYLIQEKKYGFFGEKLKKVIIEAVSFNHIDEFDEYGFDSRAVNIAEFLISIAKAIDNAEMGKYLHVIGIASPTGWEENVIKEIQSVNFAHNYVSRFVSVCLIDSSAGEVIYNSADDRIIGYVEFFKPQFDREKVEEIRTYTENKLAAKGYIVFEDTVEELSLPRELVYKVFRDLQHDGLGKMKNIKEVGLALQSKN